MASNTRSAGAAVVTCFTLACCAVLGITAIISHGRASAQHKIASPFLSGLGSAVKPGSESALTLPAGGSGFSPVPASIAPMAAEPATPRPVTPPPVAKDVDQETGAHLSSPHTTPIPVPAVAKRQIGKLSDSGKPVNQVETVAADKPSKPSESSTPDDPHPLPADSKPDTPDTPTNQDTPQSDELVNPAVSADQNDPTVSTRTGGDAATQDESGDPGSGGLSLSPRRSPTGLRSDSRGGSASGK